MTTLHDARALPPGWPKEFDSLDADLRRRLDRCAEVLRELGSVVVAFSAGVDSTFLLALAGRVLGAGKVLAAIGVSPSLAGRERRQAAELAASLGVELMELTTDELADPAYAANPSDRCFFCKSALFRRLADLAGQRKLAAVVSGANADDTGDFRPGLRAGKELGVRNPLMDAGLSKGDIRQASRALGLPTWDKPAMACLASRIPYGQPISAERLSRVERAEDVLRDLGFAQCRVRDHDTVARIEVAPADFARLLDQRAAIVEKLKVCGYAYIALDLVGFRSGSMNETLR